MMYVVLIFCAFNSSKIFGQTDTIHLSLTQYNFIISHEFEGSIGKRDTAISINDSIFYSDQLDRWLVAYLMQTWNQGATPVKVSYDSGKVFKIYTNWGEGFFGDYIEYYPNGNLKIKGQFDKDYPGIKTGKWIEYYENGQMKSYGMYIPKYNSRSDLKFERKVGLWNYYYETGQLKATGNYSPKKNGRKIGNWLYLNEEGEKYRERNYRRKK